MPHWSLGGSWRSWSKEDLAVYGGGTKEAEGLGLKGLMLGSGVFSLVEEGVTPCEAGLWAGVLGLGVMGLKLDEGSLEVGTGVVQGGCCTD